MRRSAALSAGWGKRSSGHDRLACGDRIGGGSNATSWRLQSCRSESGEQLYEPLSLKDMNIDGAEIMQILFCPPSRKIKAILNALFEEILDDSSKNTKEYLEKR